MVTIKDVARKAEVSAATVSRVMNHTARVNPETKEKILHAIHTLNYVPNEAARNMRGARRQSIEVFTDRWNFALARECADEIRKRKGAEIQVSLMQYEEKDETPAWISSGSGTLKIVFSGPGSEPVLERFNGAENKTGIISVSMRAEAGSCQNLMIDYQPGIWELVRVFEKKKSEKICYFGIGDRESTAFQLFRQSITRPFSNIQLERRIVPAVEITDGIKIAAKLFQTEKHLPSGVVFESEHAAFGFAYEAVKIFAGRAKSISLAVFGTGKLLSHAAMPCMVCKIKKRQLRENLFALVDAYCCGNSERGNRRVETKMRIYE